MRRLSLLILVFVLNGTEIMAAEDSGQPPATGNTQRHQLVANRMRLTPEEAKRFWPVYHRLHAKLSVLMERRKKLITAFGENFSDMSDQQVKNLISGRLELEEDWINLLRSYLPKFEKVLPARKVLRYYQIENRIRAQINADLAEELPLIW